MSPTSAWTFPSDLQWLVGALSSGHFPLSLIQVLGLEVWLSCDSSRELPTGTMLRVASPWTHHASFAFGETKA